MDTNGYDIEAVKEALARIGWKQPTAKGYDIVDTDNQASVSGRYFNDNSFHTALTIENIKDAQEDAKISDEDFNTYLVEQMRDPVILSMLTQVFDVPQLIKSGLVYDKYQHTAYQTITGTSKFCGLAFNLSKRGGTSVMLNNAVLLFDANASFKLYLFNEYIGKVAEWDVSVVANVQKTVALDRAIHYQSAAVQGGAWFLGYFQDDTGGAKAIDYSSDRNCFSSVKVTSFEANPTSATTVDFREYSERYSGYGLNVQISEYHDLTDKIVANAHLFDELQGLMMAAKVIELIKNTTRTNADSRIMKLNVSSYMVDLKGLKTDTGQWVPGIESKIAKTVKNIRQSFYKKAPVTVVG